MPFDGITAKCLTIELKRKLEGGLIEKIGQPDPYDISLIIRNQRESYNLLVSANPSLARIYLTKNKKPNPMKAPMFCMFLRKHLKGGHITKIHSKPYERVITIEIESMSELGDLSKKHLVIEIMGKYSNIILLNENNTILDSIRHIDSQSSRIREIMPARPYIEVPDQNKEEIDSIEMHRFISENMIKEDTVYRLLQDNIKGFSPYIINQICKQSDIDSNTQMNELSAKDVSSLILQLNKVKMMIKSNLFSPTLIYMTENKIKTKDFYSISLENGKEVEYSSSMSDILDRFYLKKSHQDFIKSRSSDLDKSIKNHIKRLNKKEKIHQKTIKDSKKAAKYKHYGELITANIYQMKRGDEVLEAVDYYNPSQNIVKITLDKTLTPAMNAQRYFKKATKLEKSLSYAYLELDKIVIEKQYLEQVSMQLEHVETIEEINEIRHELTKQGYVKKQNKKGKNNHKNISKPHHYITSDGFHVFVGKNNFQNDYLTLKYASSKDLWFHVKDYPGSHVILRYEGENFTDKSILQAALLAAHYSKQRNASNVEVDYTNVKNVKRHASKKPGLVFYVSYKTAIVTPDANQIKEILRRD